MRSRAWVWCGDARRIKAWAAVKASDVEAADELLVGFITVRLQVRPTARRVLVSLYVPPDGYHLTLTLRHENTGISGIG